MRRPALARRDMEVSMTANPGGHPKTAALSTINGPRPGRSPLRTRHSRVYRIAPVWGGMQALLAERLVADVAWTVKWRPAAAKALVGYGSMR